MCSGWLSSSMTGIWENFKEKLAYLKVYFYKFCENLENFKKTFILW